MENKTEMKLFNKITCNVIDTVTITITITQAELHVTDYMHNVSKP